MREVLEEIAEGAGRLPGLLQRQLQRQPLERLQDFWRRHPVVVGCFGADLVHRPKRRCGCRPDAALAGRDTTSGGIVDERRLRCNLLSSQPLAFNFFGHLASNLDLATRVLVPLFGLEGAEVVAIHFEYAPGKPAGDNSAFDVAVEYKRAGRHGLVGVECKYTDTFSPTEYRRKAYEQLYKMASSIFKENYEALASSRYNQLFRNQLVGEGLRRRGDFHEVHVRLFCAPGDKEARETGESFSQMINASEVASFGVSTYEDFISTAQKQALEWSDREWTMLLWARYCGMSLSDRAYEEVAG